MLDRISGWAATFWQSAPWWVGSETSTVCHSGQQPKATIVLSWQNPEISLLAACFVWPQSMSHLCVLSPALATLVLLSALLKLQSCWALRGIWKYLLMKIIASPPFQNAVLPSPVTEWRLQSHSRSCSLLVFSWFRGCVRLPLHQQPTNRILYTCAHVKGVISSSKGWFFPMNIKPFSSLLSPFFLTHVSLSPKVHHLLLTASIIWVIQRRKMRRGKVLSVTAKEGTVFFCPVKSKDWIQELCAKSILYSLLLGLLTACADGISTSRVEWRLHNVVITHILL